MIVLYFKMPDFDFKGKKVIVRVGADVPVDEKGRIKDDKRIKQSLPTIKQVLKQKPKQVILMCHLGRPDASSPDMKLSTKKVAERFGELLKKKIIYTPNWSTAGFENERLVFLENLRFNKGEKSKDENERRAFGAQLASLADYYVNDAFSNAHRKHASMYDVPLLIPGCLSEAVENEITTIRNSVDNPERPMVSIIAGLKADKLNAVKNLLGKADKILVGGALSFALLKAFGKNVGSSKVDDEGLKEFSELVGRIKESSKVVLPVDCIIADKFDESAEVKTVSVDDIPDGWMGVDIGPKTIKIFEDELTKARTIVWNGPVGVFEIRKFSKGTEEIAKFIAKCRAVKVVGGGDSAAAAAKFGVEKKMTLVSTGGGASLEIIEGNELPSLKALEQSYEKFKDILE